MSVCLWGMFFFHDVCFNLEHIQGSLSLHWEDHILLVSGKGCPPSDLPGFVLGNLELLGIWNPRGYKQPLVEVFP